MKLPIYMTTALGGPATGLTIVAVTSSDGAAFSSKGSVAEVGRGLYAYTTGAGDVGANVVLRATSGSLTPFELVTKLPTPPDFTAGATGADRYILAYLVDSDSDPVTGYEPEGDDLAISFEGGAIVEADGEWHEIGDGNYYYIPTDAEVSAAGSLVLLVAGFDGDRQYLAGVTIGAAPVVVVDPEPIPIPVEHPGIEFVDQVERAIGRLAQQFKPKGL